MPAARMVRRAFGRAFDDSEVEDIYANAWVGTLRTLEHRHPTLTDEEVRKYVLTAVAHHASKEIRRRGRKPTAPLEALGEVADVASAPDERAVATEDAALARDLLASLPKRRRAVMLLRYGWGLEPAQVCKLVKGLSPRAYRKEITRGIDELTEKLKLVERGDWCADREPLLKAFAAGTANDEELRQVRHHLARCRECSHLVGRLTGHLHSLGGATAAPGALDAVAHGGINDRVAALVDRARGALPSPFGGGDSADVASTLAAGSARGSGAAGAGVLAKLASLGASGKIALACLAGGAAATTCAATGVLPVLAPPKPVHSEHAQPVVHRAPRGPRLGPADVGASATVVTQPTAPSDSDQTRHLQGSGTTSASATSSTTTPLAPSTPPVQQEFGVGAAATSGSTQAPSSGSTSSGGDTATSGGSAVDKEFGP